MYDQLIAPATAAEADRILASWGAQHVRPLESRNATWPEPLVQIWGDLVALTRDQVAQRARRLVRRPDFRHVVRLLDMRGRRAADVPTDRLDELIDALVVEAGLPWSAGPEAIAQHELGRELAVLPFRIVVGDRYVAIRFSHAFGDLYAETRALLPLLLADADEPVPAPVPAPLIRALAHTVTRHPAKVLAAFRADRWAPPATFADGPAQLWRRELCFATSEDGWLDDLTARLDPARVSVGGWLTAAMHRATREVGIAAHPGALVVVACRRYLPAGARHLSGNFVAGSFLTVADPTDPVQTTAAIREYAASARPLLAMAASRRSDGRRARADQPHRDQLPDPDGRAYLGLSHTTRVPWPSRTVPPAGCAFNVPTPIGPDGIAAVTMGVGGRLSVSLAYREGQYDRAAIEHVAGALTGAPAAIRAR